MRPLVLLALAAAALASPRRTSRLSGGFHQLGDPNSGRIRRCTRTRAASSSRNYTLRQLILYAYEIKGYQLRGGPKWADRDRYSIEAKLDLPRGQSPRGKQLAAWLSQATRALLAEVPPRAPP